MDAYIYILVIAIVGFLLYKIAKKNVDLYNSYKYNIKLEKDIEKLKEEKKISISQYSKKVRTLENKIDILKQELSNYTDIKDDSLLLNAKDENEELDNNIKDNNEIDSSFDELNDEKQKIYKYMCDINNNLFITGKAGTGKSYLLKYYRNHTNKNVLYTAPTGVSALNIDGVTLHSAFGFNNLMDDSEIKLSSNKKTLLKKMDVLVIDEISMVRVDVFNQVDKVLKYANENDLPFGGKQVILFGDLFQLPPVVKNEEEKFLNDKYGSIFFFNSPAYKNGNFKFAELNTIFRQKQDTEKEFVSVLNHIREGKIIDSDIKTLNERYNPLIPKRITQVVPKKDEANRINEDNYNKLKSKEFIYNANIIFGKDGIKETDFPCDFCLKLKVGSLVMVIVNDTEEPRRYVNGTLGIVSKLTDDEVTVMINGINHVIKRYSFDKYNCNYDKENKKMEYIVEARVEQFPLILAYAITIHKSQGMTYQSMACNLDNCFAPGQAYVALSRCAEFKKLYITSRVTPKSFITNKEVVEYYLEMKKKEL